MRQLLASLCALALVSAMVSPVMAWGPAPEPPWFTGQRVEMLTDQAAPGPSPAPACDDMVLEPIEPHVMRLLDDGADHDLTKLDTFEDLKPVSLISVGDDGSVWLTSNGGFIRIGTPGEAPDPFDTFRAQMEIGSDGTLWVADGHHGSTIGEWRSGSWTIHELPVTAWVTWLDATPEGGLDFAWRDGSALIFGALPASDLNETAGSSPPPLELGSPDGRIAVARTPDGRVWVVEGLWWEAERRRAPGSLWVFDGTAWQRVQPLGDDPPTQPSELVVDGSGRLWVTWQEVVPGTSDLGPARYLTRRDNEESWTVISEPVEAISGGLLSADEDSIWLSPRWCGGYVNFDGEQLVPYLDGLCVRLPGISPTGDIWLFGHDRGRRNAGVYIITPTPVDSEGPLGYCSDTFAQSPSPSSSPRFGGRVEMPEHGFVIALPSDWLYADASAAPDDWWDLDNGPPEEQRADFIERGGVLIARNAVGTPAVDEYCKVSDWSAAHAQRYVNAIRRDPRAVASQPFHLVELSGGPALVHDVLHDNGVDWREYLITDGERWLAVTCGSTVPPQDRWLSIAETIEFLPDS